MCVQHLEAQQLPGSELLAKLHAVGEQLRDAQIEDEALRHAVEGFNAAAWEEVARDAAIGRSGAELERHWSCSLSVAALREWSNAELLKMWCAVSCTCARSRGIWHGCLSHDGLCICCHCWRRHQHRRCDHCCIISCWLTFSGPPHSLYPPPHTLPRICIASLSTCMGVKPGPALQRSWAQAGRLALS